MNTNGIQSKLLTEWAERLAMFETAGQLSSEKVRLQPGDIHYIAGPRAGVLLVNAGPRAGRMLSALRADDYAKLRFTVTWRFSGEPEAFMSGHYLRLEAGWPDQLARKSISLLSINERPKDGKTWAAGITETGRVKRLELSDITPHWLFPGSTGSGKTWAMRSAIAQLSLDITARFVLIDGKYGEGLDPLGYLPGLVGPVARDMQDAKGALSWAVHEMRRRYESHSWGGPLIVAIDEIQEFAGRAGDPAAAEMIRRLVAQGRAAGVHLLIGTQHPTKEALGDGTIRRNVLGRVALRVEDAVASLVAVGGEWPRADHLLGAGDCYIVAPGEVHRTQLAYVPKEQLDAMSTARPELDAWPEFDPEAAGSLPEPTARWDYSGDELGVSIVAAMESKGLPTLITMLNERGIAARVGDRSRAIMKKGREALARVQSEGYDFVKYD